MVIRLDKRDRKSKRIKNNRYHGQGFEMKLKAVLSMYPLYDTGYLDITYNSRLVQYVSHRI